MPDVSTAHLNDGTPIVPPARITIAADFSLAVRRLGHGGIPLLLLHGFPCTSLIWTKVMQPLADAGFDAVAPDLRGYGDSDYAPDDFYDLAAFGGDMIALANALGWDRFAVSGHDLGAAVAIQMANTFPDRVDRLLLMNHGIPERPGHPEWAAIGQLTPAQAAAIFDYADRQGNDADGLLAELPTPGARRRYVASFYTNRVWCPPGAFSGPDLDLLLEPYADARRLRTSFIDYEIIAGNHPLSAPERLDQPVRQPVVVLLGPDEVTFPPGAVARCRLAYPDLIGPFVVPDSGHFMQWEQPATVVSSLRGFFGRWETRPKCRPQATAGTGPALREMVGSIMVQSATKTIEIRRHAERHKPGANLNARGVGRARNASARDRAYALVVTSPLPRAIQTAVAMGHAVDEEDWTMATMGVAMDAFPWDADFAAVQRAIRESPVAAGYATHQAAELRAWLSRIDSGEALLVVSHGGIAEIGIIGLLGDVDASPLGPSLDTCEGARIELDGDRVTQVDLLRFNDDDEEYTERVLAL